MKHISHVGLTLFIPIFLSACASTPTPAEICSSEWITPRAERAVNQIEKRTKRSIKALVNASESWAAGKTPGPLQMFALSRSLKSLEKELTQGKGIQDLKTVAKTCNDPEIISDSIRDLMERQGLSDRFISQIEAFPLYIDILEDIAKDTGQS